MEILRDLQQPPRFLHASSREIFGSPEKSPQDESTPFAPVSPYGCAKAFATQMTRIYREAHGLFFCNAICYNHESPRRGENFVTRKVSLAAARIQAGLQKQLSLGDLDAARDWGYAVDFVNAMWLMLQQPAPDDYVLATGKEHTIRELLSLAFERVGLDWRNHVREEQRFIRPADACGLLGNAAKAQQKLGWTHTLTFRELIHLMVDEDVRQLAERPVST
jgi:GDPmannose 4,6-dehydratase